MQAKAAGVVLVTGGAGFVGSHVVRKLLLRGAVVVLDNLSTGKAANIPTGAEVHVGDVRSKADVCRVLREGVTAIVHCAAQTSVARSMKDPETDWAINVAGTHQLVRLARRFGTGRFVFISSGGAVYGESPLPAEESDLPQPSSRYGLHKFAAEQIVRLESPSHAILRPANVYGPAQRTDVEGGVVAVFLDRLLTGEKLEVHGDGRQRRDFVYVDDVANAVQLALSWPSNVIWNVASGHSTSILELLRTLEELTDRQARVRWRPRRPGDVDVSQLSSKLLAATGGWGPPLDLRAGLMRLLAETDAGAFCHPDAVPVVTLA